MTLSEKIYAATRVIPKGRVATYGDIAAAIGHPRAWRAVGNVLTKNRDPKTPCHRVVRSDGRVGGFGYPEGTPRKVRTLVKEGIFISEDEIDLTRFRVPATFIRSVRSCL